METKKIRELVPENKQKMFDDIKSGAILGASNHIKMIGEMFIEIGKQTDIDDKEKLARISKISNYYKETRGKSSYAIINALNAMTSSLSSLKGNVKEGIKNEIENYFKHANANVDKIIQYTNKLTKDMKVIMVFDYSSTVEKFIASIPHRVKIYIPESRAIDGGKPFIKKALEANHDVHFILDAAMLTVLKECDAIFIGAETFYPDGTAFNTVGSDILAHLCKEYKIPYYVLTPMLKVDMRPLQGEYKEVIASDLADKLSENWETNLKEKVNFNCIELVAIDPEYITAYVSEEGILPISAIYHEACLYQERIGNK
ncbi:MAG: initiation factor 2 [Erysipelotrichaceae bacterium]